MAHHAFSVQFSLPIAEKMVDMPKVSDVYNPQPIACAGGDHSEDEFYIVQDGDNADGSVSAEQVEVAAMIGSPQAQHRFFFNIYYTNPWQQKTVLDAPRVLDTQAMIAIQAPVAEYIAKRRTIRLLMPNVEADLSERAIVLTPGRLPSRNSMGPCSSTWLRNYIMISVSCLIPNSTPQCRQ
jgi:hypothetical protein